MDADAELVVAFLNTLDTETGADELDGQAAWARWASGHHLPAAGDVAAAHDARDALRAAASGGTAAEVTVAARAGVVGGRPTTVALDATGAILLAAARLAEAGTWPRIKLCAAETCRWAFLDESRNRSRSWCSMEVCGNRAKARTFRARHRP